MYHISLYENGQFYTHIGGAVSALAEAMEQMSALTQGISASKMSDYLGYKFDRAGTPCALIVTDRWGMPICEERED